MAFEPSLLGRRLYFAITRPRANPTVDDTLASDRVGGEQFIGHFTSDRQQGLVDGEIGNPQRHDAGLTSAEDFAGSPQLQVTTGDGESVITIAQDAKPLARQGRKWAPVLASWTRIGTVIWTCTSPITSASRMKITRSPT